MSKTHEIRLVGAGGEYMDSATVIEWTVAVGDPVKVGDIVVVVETAKASTEISAEIDGTLLRIDAQPGDEVEVGAALGLVGPAGSDSGTGGAVDAGAVTSSVADDHPAPADASTDAAPSGRVFATPLARSLARQRGIHLATVSGSGPRGRIKARDLAAAPATEPAPVPAPTPAPAPSAVRAKPAATKPAGRGYRGAMAAQMERTLEVPQFSVAMECDGTHILKLRRRIKAVNGTATVNDLVIVAVARALRKHPGVNALWRDGDVHPMADVSIGVAMATSLGLVVPVIHNADRLSVGEVSAEVASLHKLAEAQKLETRHITGAGFTVSNLGGFGASAFTAIVNPPQVGILAVPAFIKRFVFEGERVEARPIAAMSLSADHRAVDGAAAASFLRDLKIEIERGDFGI